METELKKYVQLDQDLVSAAKSIKVLTNLEWPEGTAQAFIKNWEAGTPLLPEPKYHPVSYESNIEKLTQIRKQCDPKHPIGGYLSRTASSYERAARMIQVRGKPEF